MPKNSYIDTYKSLKKKAEKGKDELIGNDKNLLKLLKQADKIDILLYKQPTTKNIAIVIRALADARREVIALGAKQHRGLPYDKGLSELAKMLSKAEGICQQQFTETNRADLAGAS